MHTDELLSSRFRPLRLRGKRIDRQRLLDRLDEAVNHRLTLVTAPAGFGKSTLLAQWSSVSDVPITWVSLTETENDPCLMVAYLAAAFQAAGVDLPAFQNLQSEAGAPQDEQLVSALLGDLQRISTPCCLILDDYEVIESNAAHGVVQALITHAPVSVYVVIGSRVLPSWALEHLHVDGRLQHIDADDLRLTLAETYGFRDMLGLRLSDDDLRVLYERTGGWIAGLQMFAISLAESETSVVDLLGHFDATNQLLNDFVRQEIVEKQVPDMQAFLLRSALFSRLSDDLCRGVLDIGQPESDVLERARGANLFLMPLDRDGTWFAYQPLFKDVLLDCATTILSARERTVLYRRASYWCEQEGLRHEAIDYALAGEDWPHAVTMIVPAVSAMFGREEITTALDWLQALPEYLLESDAELTVVAGWAHLRSGALADVPRLLATAQRLYEEAGDTLGLANVSAAYAELARYHADGVTVIAHARRSQDLLAQYERQSSSPATSMRHLAIDPLLSRRIDALVRLQIGAGLFRQGKANDAGNELLAAHAHIIAHHIPVFEATAMLQIGHVRMLQGRLDDAFACYQAIPTSPDSFIVSRRIALTCLAEILRERHQFEDAQQLLDECQSIVDNSPLGFGLWNLRLGQARLAWSRRATSQALEYAELAARRVRSVGMTYHTSIAEAFAIRVRLSHGDIGAALAWAFDRRLAPDDPPLYEQLHEHLVYARLLVAQGTPDEAIGLLSRCLDAAEGDGRIGDAIEIGILLALALLESADFSQAVDALGKALRYGERGGYLHVFADNGLPMLQLLQGAQERGVSPAYCQQIQDVLSEVEAPVSIIGAGVLDDPISARELDVLRLIADGLSNSEIASSLRISGFAVTRHIESVHSKLGVWTQAEALYKARALGLLAASDDAVREFDPSPSVRDASDDR